MREKQDYVITYAIIIFLLFLAEGVAATQSYEYVMQIGPQRGFYLSGDGGLNQPGDVAVDSSGNIYVADTGNRRVQKYSYDGKYITQWDSRGTKYLKLSGPQVLSTFSPFGIAVGPDDNIYVSDSTGNRVIKFSSAGEYLRRWGSKGTGNGQFNMPEGIVVDANGNVYVADSHNNRIQKFSSDGIYLLQWDVGQYGLDLGRPTFVSADSMGNVFVASSSDLFVNFILKFKATGEYITGWDDHHLYYPCGIEADADGNTFITTESQTVQKYSPSGLLLMEWGSHGTGHGEFRNPAGITVDMNGNVYVADSGNNRIQKFSPVILPEPPQAAVPAATTNKAALPAILAIGGPGLAFVIYGTIRKAF